MLREPIHCVDTLSGRLDDSTLATLSTSFDQGIERRPDPASSDPRTEALRHLTVLDSISVGVCYFDDQEQMILCNRRYAEIYGLSPEQVRPGATMREIAKSRAAAGTCPVEADDGFAYYAWCSALISSAKPSNWTVALKNGRTIKLLHQPTPDGGWVTTHEDITGLQDNSTVANTRLSLQTLIDWVPDNLWVKDNKSRFVIANKCDRTPNGVQGPRRSDRENRPRTLPS